MLAEPLAIIGLILSTIAAVAAVIDTVIAVITARQAPEPPEPPYQPSVVLFEGVSMHGGVRDLPGRHLNDRLTKR